MLDQTNQTTSLTSDRVQLTPVQTRHRVDAATGYSMLGMYDHALHELTPFQRSHSAAVACLRGDIFRDQERHQEALDHYDIALKIEHGHLMASIGQAWCFKRTDSLEDAIETLQDAATRHPREALLQYNLACYFALAEDKPRCLSHLGVALRLEPAYAELVDEETDFDLMRRDADFERLISVVMRACSGTTA